MVSSREGWQHIKFQRLEVNGILVGWGVLGKLGSGAASSFTSSGVLPKFHVESSSLGAGGRGGHSQTRVPEEVAPTSGFTLTEKTWVISELGKRLSFHLSEPYGIKG